MARIEIQQRKFAIHMAQFTKESAAYPFGPIESGGAYSDTAH